MKIKFGPFICGGQRSVAVSAAITAFTSRLCGGQLMVIITCYILAFKSGDYGQVSYAFADDPMLFWCRDVTVS